MYVLLFDYQHSSPIIDNIISNNGEKYGVIPYCRIGAVVDYVLQTKIINENIELLNQEATTSLINSQCHSIIKSSDDICGRYYTENYNRDGYMTFRIESVDTTKPWTIIRNVGEYKESILYIDDKKINKFQCYSKSYNYFLPNTRCEIFKEYDETNNKISPYSNVEWLRGKEITLIYNKEYI